MNLQRREEIREMIAEIEASTLDGSATVRDLCTLDAMRELLAHIDTLEQTAAERVIADGRAPAVVVPDDDRPSREFLENYVEGFDPGERSAALFGWREGRRHLRERIRTITPNRVLVEGMVGMDRKKIESAASFLEEYASRVPGISAVIAALRANQGGAAK